MSRRTRLQPRTTRATDAGDLTQPTRDIRHHLFHGGGPRCNRSGYIQPKPIVRWFDWRTALQGVLRPRGTIYNQEETVTYYRTRSSSTGISSLQSSDMATAAVSYTPLTHSRRTVTRIHRNSLMSICLFSMSTSHSTQVVRLWAFTIQGSWTPPSTSNMTWLMLPVNKSVRNITLQRNVCFSISNSGKLNG